MQAVNFFELLLVAFTCFQLLGVSHESKLPQDEVHALQEITRTMGANNWKFNDSCGIDTFGVTQELSPGSERRLVCDCSFENNTVCHVVNIDLAYNLFTGTIPKEWASMNLTSISLLVNRLSGEIPSHLGNITTLTYLMLEANQFSGVIPPEFGSLINLRTLVLSSNQLTGSLPGTLAGLQNLIDL